jgi:hypothetical protein
MDRMRSLAHGRIRLVGAAAGTLTLLWASAALAVSAPLAPGANIAVPSTTAASEPTLAGGVIHDALVPFSIKTAAGEVLCTGQLQDRVVRSTRTGRLDFYYRIRSTQGPGAVRGVATSAFGGVPLQVGYRLDGLGTVPPRLANRSPTPGAVVTFEITDPPVSCAQHQETRFILIRTPVSAFHVGGKTQIIATTWDEVSVPTVMP